MAAIRTALAIVLAGFLVLTGYVLVEYGFTGFYLEVTQNAATLLAFTDLAIALTILMGWMVMDARRTGRNPTGYILITLAIGIAGPLLYMITGDTFRKKA